MRPTRMLFQKLGEGFVGPASMPHCPGEQRGPAWASGRMSSGMVGGLSRTGPCGEGQHHWKHGWAAITKNEIMPCAAIWRDLESVILKSVRQRKTNIIWYHLYVESKKMDTNELLFTKQKLTHRLIEHKLIDTKRGKVVGDKSGVLH